jgi:hypothetical protein
VDPKAVRIGRGSRPAVRRRAVAFALATLGIVLALVVAGGIAAQAGAGCATCHAMRPYATGHTDGAHADERCVTCHIDGGLAGIVPTGLRAVGWGIAAVAGRTPAVTLVSDDACRTCHEAELGRVVTAQGVAVRHADFAAQPCDDCHAGTAHRVADRHYRTLEMDDCMGCHKGAANDPSSCDLCHVGESERREGATSWRATHGPRWETTHGMGDISTCGACHAPRVCIGCHGVLIPHPADWVVSHGTTARTELGGGCVSCHREGWCIDCHGMEMPHPAGFLPDHGPIADELGADACNLCHDERGCYACHIASSHIDVPGLTTGHRW